MQIRAFRPEDAAPLAELSGQCARGEADFVLNPMWESPVELFAEFERHEIDPAEYLLVADADAEGVLGMSGYLRYPGSAGAGLLCPIVQREERGHGLGGRLLRAALELGAGPLGLQVVTAAVGTRNRAGYSLLTALGFRAMRQMHVMRCDVSPEGAPLALEGMEASAAGPEDAEAILEIYRTCPFPERGADRMAQVLADPRHDHVVAKDAGGRVVAFVELETHWPGRPWVAFVGVEPELRDQGLGSSLVAWSLARRFEDGADMALLVLSPTNRLAVRAYEKVGFRRWRLVDVLEKAL